MRFAVLQLTGCAGCEVSLLNAGDELDLANLAYMPLVVTAHDVPEVDVLLVTGGIRTDEDLLKLRESASRVKKIISVGTTSLWRRPSITPPGVPGDLTNPFWRRNLEPSLSTGNS